VYYLCRPSEIKNDFFEKKIRKGCGFKITVLHLQPLSKEGEKHKEISRF